jgi:hypothetical protein
MSRERSISALTDEERRLVAAAEQDLDRLLTIEPSPDFVAKVRARIREEERPASWRGRWVTAVAVAAAIVVIAGIALTVATMRRTPAGEEQPAATQAAMGHDVSLPAPIPDPGSRTPNPGPRVGTHVARSHATARVVPQRRPAPELLIDPRRRDAVDRLLVMVRSGVTDLPMPAPEENRPIEAQALTVPPVVVEQLEVPLLPVSGGLEERNAERR